MRKKKIITGLSALGLAAVVGLAGFTSSAQAVSTNVFQLATSGSQANITSDLKVTPDGKYAVFSSYNSGLVSGDTNSKGDIFVKNIATGSLTRVSVSSTGTQSDGNSDLAAITNNGRYVLFRSFADNIATINDPVSGQAYKYAIYLHDMQTGATTEVVSSYDNTRDVEPDALSEDARFVYFVQSTPADIHNRIMLRDRLLNTTAEITTNNSGTPASTGNSNAVSTSCDGRFAVFQSDASDLVSGDTSDTLDSFLVDSMNTHTIKKINMGTDGTLRGENPQISCDGSTVLYFSSSTDSVGGDTNGKPDVFIYHVASDTTERVSLGTSNSQFSTEAGGAKLSANGRYVAFGEYEAQGSNNVWETYIRNLDTGTTVLASQDSSSNPADGGTLPAALNDDGTQLVLQTYAGNLGFTNTSHDLYYVKSTNFGI